MSTAWIEPHSGIAGDMTIAALHDLGVPQEVVADACKTVGFGGYDLRFGRSQQDLVLDVETDEAAIIERVEIDLDVAIGKGPFVAYPVVTPPGRLQRGKISLGGNECHDLIPDVLADRAVNDHDRTFASD